MEPTRWDQPSCAEAPPSICAANSRPPANPGHPGSWFSPPGHSLPSHLGRFSLIKQVDLRVERPCRTRLDTAASTAPPTDEDWRQAMPMVDIITQRARSSCDARVTLLKFAVEYLPSLGGHSETAPPDRSPGLYLDERPRSSIAVGDAPLDKPVYRAHVRVMSGFVEESRVDGLVREVTEAIVRADGTDGPVVHPSSASSRKSPVEPGPWTALCGTATSPPNQSAPTRTRRWDPSRRRGQSPHRSTTQRACRCGAGSCSMTTVALPISPVLAIRVHLYCMLKPAVEFGPGSSGLRMFFEAAGGRSRAIGSASC